MGGILSFFSKLVWGDTPAQRQPQMEVHNNNDDGPRPQIIEELVAQVSEIKNGEMKEVSLGQGKVLLCRDEAGEFSAVGSKCTHYAAPLKNGAYSNNRVRCPWHGACFNTKTGDIEDFPAVDGLPVFDVRVEGDNIYVKGDAGDVRTSKKTPHMCPGRSDKRVFVIVGGGAAGASAAQTLRQHGFSGRILVLGREKVLPYDRPKLSKAMTVSIDTITLRPQEFWDKHGVEFKLGAVVTELDANKKLITLEDGEQITYDSCLIATGGTPRALPVNPPVSAPNVYLLRDFDQAGIIDAAVVGKKVLIVGSSFIGMETAAAISTKAASVTVVGMEKVPFERVLGPQIGAAMQALHESNGVKFKMQSVLESVKMENGLVTSVTLKNGEEIECDVIAVGAGVVPTTGFIKGLELGPRDQSVLCDVHMKTSADGLYAAGDIARFPLKMLNDESVRIEHWGMAQKQGSVAAMNMAGVKTAMDSVPYFWTAMYGKTVRYCGHALAYDEVIFDMAPDGLSPASLKFVAFFSNKGTIAAVASLARDPVVSICAELMQSGKMPNASQIKAAIEKDGKSDSFLQSLM